MAGAVVLAGILLGLILRAGWIGMHAADPTQDRDAYLVLAQRIASGQGFVQPDGSATAFRPPLYPMMLAAVQQVGSPRISVIVVNLLASMCTGLLIVVMINRTMQNSLSCLWGITAGLTFWAVDPLLVVYTSQPMTEVVCAALVVSTVAVATAANTGKGYFLAGLLAGLTALCRPAFLLWTACVIVILAAEIFLTSRRHRSSGSSLRMAAFSWLLLGAVIPPGLWMMRNLVVSGFPILTTTHGGYTVHLANNEVFYRDVVGKSWSATWEGSSFAGWEAANRDALIPFETLTGIPKERAIDQWHSHEARQTIATRPWKFLEAALLRELQLWSPTPQTALPTSLRLGLWLEGITLFGLAIMGLWRLPRDQPVLRRLILAAILTTACVHLVYWTNTRMRTPIEPLLIVLAGSAVGSMRRVNNGIAVMQAHTVPPNATYSEKEKNR